MQKRVYLILLIVGAVVGIILVVVFLIKPFSGTPSTQPAPLDRGAVERPFNPAEPPTFQSATGPAPDVNSPEEQERQAQEALKRQAMSYAGRQGSYSSIDGFESMRQVYPESTKTLADFLEAERQKLIAAHPSYGPSYGRTTRSLSANIVSSEPILTGTKAVLEVQAQVLTNEADGTEHLTYEKITVSFEKSNGEWVANDIRRDPLQL